MSRVNHYLNPLVADNFITVEQANRIFEMSNAKAGDDRDMALMLSISLCRECLKQLIEQLSPHNIRVLQAMSSYYLILRYRLDGPPGGWTAENIVNATERGKLVWLIKECKQMLGHKYEYKT